MGNLIQGGSTIHLFDIDALAEKLRSNTLTERESFRYFLLSIALGVLSVFPQDWRLPAVSYSPSLLLAIQFVWFVTAIVGTVICFNVNQRSDGMDFTRRFICLSIPAGVRSLIYTLLLMFLIAIPVIIFAQKGDRDLWLLLMKGVGMEMMMIFQIVMIYQRLRGFSNHAAENGGTAAE